jgi:uncharacterized alkaline shock family protein YloU
LGARGATTMGNTVFSTIAGVAAREVEGVHMGGGASRTAGGVLGSLTGSESKASGISVEVGRTETAIDLKMGIEYNKNILQTVEEVRRRITDRIESMTGLRVKELNATITDITFPEKEERRRLGSRSATREREDSSVEEASTASEPEPEITEVEPTSRAHTEGASGPVPEEDVSVEGRPLEEDEIAEVRPGDASTEEHPTDETQEADTHAEPEPTEEVETRTGYETSEEAETRADDETSETTETSAGPEASEQDDAEIRRRRRAEERARRRRRSQDS